MQRNGTHPTFGKEGADSVFEVGDDVHHGRCPVGVAAIVGRVAVEKLRELGVLQVPLVVAV